MRAVICRELTGVGGLEYVNDWPEPQAGPGEVLVEVKAAALNFPDLLMIQACTRSGRAAVRGRHRDVGRGRSGGRGRHARRAGRQGRGCVWPDAGRARRRKGAVRDSGAQELGFEAAAGICITYFTSMHALKQRAQLRAGETLLVLGAAGGVGTTAVELGKQMGAVVIAAASSDAKLELARKLGADHVVNYATRTCASASRRSRAARGST